MEISNKIITQLRKEAALAFPDECCGILLGENDEITSLLPTANVHQAPRTHFEIDPAALIAAYKAERGAGPEIIGFYHSHPSGGAEPSATDAAMAAGDGKVWAIIGAETVKFWRDDAGGFEPLSYTVLSE